MDGQTNRWIDRRMDGRTHTVIIVQTQGPCNQLFVWGWDSKIVILYGDLWDGFVYPTLTLMTDSYMHVRIQKVLSEGDQLWQHFFNWWGEGGSKYHYKRAIIGPPAKRHLNGVSLACRWWPNIECWLEWFVIFRGSGPILLRNPLFWWIFRGGGVRTPCSRPLDPRMICMYIFSLGAPHDSGDTDSGCSPNDDYIMQPYVPSVTAGSTHLEPWRFSNCSIQEFRDYLASLE